MDAKEQPESAFRAGGDGDRGYFLGGGDGDGDPYDHESSVLEEFGWDIPGDYGGGICACDGGYLELDPIGSDFAGSCADGGAWAETSAHELEEEKKQAAAVAPAPATNQVVTSNSSEDPIEKPTASGDSTAYANPPADTACKAKRKGPKRIRQQRYAFVTKSDVDNLEDGYRWRKYGQKAVKNSTFPRSYYRCTNGKCTVKKLVERSSEDPSSVITTYEGQHSHHLTGFHRLVSREPALVPRLDSHPLLPFPNSQPTCNFEGQREEPTSTRRHDASGGSDEGLLGDIVPHGMPNG